MMIDYELKFEEFVHELLLVKVSWATYYAMSSSSDTCFTTTHFYHASGEAFMYSWDFLSCKKVLKLVTLEWDF